MYIKKISLQPDCEYPLKTARPVDFIRLLSVLVFVFVGVALEAQVPPVGQQSEVRFEIVQLEQTKGDCQSEEGCVVVVLHFPVMVKGPDSVKALANAMIRTAVARTFGEVPHLSSAKEPLQQAMKWFAEQWNQVGRSNGQLWLHHVEGELTLLTPKVAGIKLRVEQQSDVFMPVEFVSTCMLDLRTGKPLEFRNALSNPKAFHRLAEAKLRQLLSDSITMQEGYLITSDEDYEVELRKDGISLWFNPLWKDLKILAPVEVFLPWSSLKGIVDKAAFF